MSVAVIQGASGGLGTALIRHLLRHTNLDIYALTHRSSTASVRESILSPELEREIQNRLSVVPEVDGREEEGLERAAGIIRSREGEGVVRTVVCLAGVLHPEKSLSAIDARDALSAFQINALGQLLTYKHIVPLIPTKKQFQDLKGRWGEAGDPAKGIVDSDSSICCSLSARVGSIEDNRKGGWYSYRASKAALNQIIRTLDHELLNKSSSAIAYAYHPGTVLTSFTKPVIGEPAPNPSKGVFDVEHAVHNMVDVMGRVKRGEEGGKPGGDWGGRCWDYNGNRIQW